MKAMEIAKRVAKLRKWDDAMDEMLRLLLGDVCRAQCSLLNLTPSGSAELLNACPGASGLITVLTTGPIGISSFSIL